jgi:hypothetical protein
MPWLLFALALGAIFVAFSTFSIGLAAISLLAALGFAIAGTLMLASARISRQSQSPSRMLDPKAIEALRKRRQAEGSGDADGPDARAADKGKRSDEPPGADKDADGSGGDGSD